MPDLCMTSALALALLAAVILITVLRPHSPIGRLVIFLLLDPNRKR